MFEYVKDGSTEIRREFVYELARASQSLLCELLVCSNEQMPRILRALDRLASPQTRFEELLLQGLLFEVALGHAHAPATQRAALIREMMSTLLSTRCRKPLLEAPVEERAACCIARRFTKLLDTGSIARHVGCHPTKLRRLFRRRYAMTMREYHRRLRIRDAIRRFAAGQRDILSVVRSVGYMAEKNFYRAVRELTQRTPARLASLPENELIRMADAIVPCSIRCEPACHTCLLDNVKTLRTRTA